VNYPLKAALVEMVDGEHVDIHNSVHTFCISNLTMQLAKIGMNRCVNAWNQHRIQGMFSFC